jgi:hypothetical protein
MAKFPIEYSQELPPAQGPNVRAHLNTDTGAGAVWGQISKAGGEMFGLGLKMLQDLQDGKDVIAQSTAKRKYDETMNAAYQAAGELTDPAASKGLLDKAMKDVEGIPQTLGLSPRVAKAFTAHYNNTIGGWESSFAVQALGNQKRQIHADAEANIQANLEHGTPAGLVEAGKEIEHLHKFHLITDDQYERAMKELPATGALTYADHLIKTEDPSSVRKAEDILTKLDTAGMSTEQLERRNASLKLAKQQGKVNTDEAMNKVLFTMDDNWNKSPAQKAAIGHQLRNDLKRTAGITPAELRTMLDRIDAFETGDTEKAIKTDKFAEADLYGLIRTLSTDSDKYEVKNVRQVIQAMSDKLSTESFVALTKALDSRLDKASADAVNYVIESGIQNNFLTKGVDDADFGRALESWAHSQKTPPGPKEITAHGLAMAIAHEAGQKKKPAKDVFTAAHIQQTLGELQSKGATSIMGVVVPFMSAEDAVNHAVRKLGPDWQTIAPEAKAIIEKNWPGTFPAPTKSSPWGGNKEQADELNKATNASQ